MGGLVLSPHSRYWRWFGTQDSGWIKASPPYAGWLHGCGRWGVLEGTMSCWLGPVDGGDWLGSDGVSVVGRRNDVGGGVIVTCGCGCNGGLVDDVVGDR